jgi:RNA polymerase sigma factor (sigma-70 family)
MRCDCPPEDCAARVKEFLAGNQAAGEVLANKFRPLVFAVVKRVLGPGRRGQWEDAVQAALLRVLARLHTWQGRAPFCKWLAVVVAHWAIDFIRRDEPVAPLIDQDVPDPSGQAKAFREALDCIEEVAAGLPTRQRQLYEWLVEGVAHTEMARRLGLSLRTVQYDLEELRARLRPCLER